MHRQEAGPRPADGGDWWAVGASLAQISSMSIGQADWSMAAPSGNRVAGTTVAPAGTAARCGLL